MQTGQQHMHHANRPRAHDNDSFPHLDMQRPLPTQHTGERFNQRSRRRIKTCGDGNQISWPGRRRRYTPIFSERAVIPDANSGEMLAQVVITAHRLAREAQRRIGGDEYTLTKTDAADLCADGSTMASALM